MRRLRSAAETRAWARRIWLVRVCALAALGLLERFFLRREFLLQGRLPVQELLQFVLWLHLGRR